ncbi:hypothetical protein ACJZ2D_010878 [Fusarium nematophilum]
MHKIKIKTLWCKRPSLNEPSGKYSAQMCSDRPPQAQPEQIPSARCQTVGDSPPLGIPKWSRCRNVQGLTGPFQASLPVSSADVGHFWKKPAPSPPFHQVVTTRGGEACYSTSRHDELAGFEGLGLKNQVSNIDDAHAFDSDPWWRANKGSSDNIPHLAPATTVIDGDAARSCTEQVLEILDAIASVEPSWPV